MAILPDHRALVGRVLVMKRWPGADGFRWDSVWRAEARRVDRQRAGLAKEVQLTQRAIDLYTRLLGAASDHDDRIEANARLHDAKQRLADLQARKLEKVTVTSDALRMRYERAVSRVAARMGKLGLGAGADGVVA